MKIMTCTLQFLTPAFLGNAEQNAQWRTPPIKAQLRQWWRMAYAADHHFKVDVAAMRHEEGLLFGHAWLDDDRDERGDKVAARKSLVRIRLAMPTGQPGTAWGAGTQHGVAPLKVVQDTSYAWFGLVKRGQGLPDRNAIDVQGAESKRALLLAFPEKHAECIDTTLRLITQFGQLGSRSRGGWGSIHIGDIPPMLQTEMVRFSQPLEGCLRHDWPMSLCSDARGLCLWESKESFASWADVMRVIAVERRKARLALKTPDGRDLRPVLGFASPGRMPSPLRWRCVLTAPDQLAIRVFAMPSLIPADGKQRIDHARTASAWKQVIAVMDESSVFKPRGGQK